MDLGGRIPSEHKAEASMCSWPENPYLGEKTGLRNRLTGEVTGPAGGRKGVLLA